MLFLSLYYTQNKGIRGRLKNQKINEKGLGTFGSISGLSIIYYFRLELDLMMLARFQHVISLITCILPYVYLFM